MWIRLSGRRLEVMGSCGCVETFYVTRDFAVDDTTLITRCGSAKCAYDSSDLPGVATRLIACLRKAFLRMTIRHDWRRALSWQQARPVAQLDKIQRKKGDFVPKLFPT